MKSRAFLLAVLVAVPAAAQRLPQNAVPAHYRITLKPDLASETFAGDETIDVDVRQPSTAITLNAAEIDFDTASITSGGRSQKAQVSLDATNQTATLTVPEPLSGSATIDVAFRGKLNDKLRGFYISRTPRRKYAVTQFESTDARRAFPSFDEPALKATFDISTVIDNGDTAISNGRILSDTPGPGEGKHTIRFASTKRLPTYLIALLIGDFQCTSGSTDAIPIRVCTTPDKVQLTHFAVNAAEKELHFYNDWYGIKYPFEKLDIIGIPDFAAGAMENAGAMTFRESALLVDEKSGAVQTRRAVASVIAHELAHQWFGDLVTMKWWNDIFLNEGFATWMAPKAVAALNPAWSTTADVAQSTGRSLTSDSLPSTRAIRTAVETPREIESVFDQIAYGKSAAVLRMVESYIGPELFRSGIRTYLTRFSYSNASAEDFWNTMTEATKQPLDRILQSYVLQPGAPVVSVSTKCEGGSTRVTLSQRRFFASKADLQNGSKTVWTIPIIARNPEGDRQLYHLLLDEPSHTFSLTGCEPHLFLNAEGTGYYRSEYAPGVLDESARLRTELTTAEKVSLVTDEWALVRAGELKVGQFLGRLQALLAVHEPLLIESAIPAVISVGESLTSDADRAAYQAWVRGLLSPIARDAGWARAPEDLEEVRGEVLMALGGTGDDAEVKQRARDMAAKIVSSSAVDVDPQLATAALMIAAQSGDAALLESLEARIAAAKSPEERRMYMLPLASFTDPALVRRALEWTLTPAVRSQDRASVIGAILANERARPVAWPWVKEHWADIEKALPPFMSGRIVLALSRGCSTAEREDLKAFLAAHPSATSERSARAAVERINNCIAFHDEQAENLDTFLRRTAEGASK